MSLKSDQLTVDVEKGDVPPPTIVVTEESAPSPVPPPRKKTFLGRLKIKFRRVYKKLGLKHVASLGIVVLYTLIGGLAFLATEYYSDLDEKLTEYDAFRNVKDSLSADLYDTVINCTYVQRAELYKDKSACLPDIDKIIAKYDDVVHVAQITNTTKWDIWYSVYFACTIYTTIGYGDIYCKTVAGRLLTMLYALFGIPLLLTTLNDLGKGMFNFIHRLITYWNSCTGFITNNISSFYNRYVDHKSPSKDDLPPSTIQYSTVQEVEAFDSESVRESPPPVYNTTLKGGDEIDVVKIQDPEEMIQVQNDEEEEEEKEIPVLLALVVTVGWIFGCAALFCLWEDWTYFASIYFFFISLTTIGLGDVTPEHPKYMIMSYFLVIVGLSLVSMCINVIQRRLEKLYYQLLQMILDEYTKQLSTGSNQLNATMGMMRMWNQNTKAKFLVPLLSKDKKQSVAQKFQEEKKAQGITLPPMLKQMDTATGMPVMFSVAKQEELEEPEFFEVAVLESLQKAESLAIARKDSIPEVQMAEPEVATRLPAVLYDASTETEKLSVEDKHEQTIIVESFDEQVQTDYSATNLQVDDTSQTTLIDYEEAEAQTSHAEVREEECQTTQIAKKEASNQTSKMVCIDQELQTHLFDLLEQEIQTEPPPTKNQRIQTPNPEYTDFAMQTEPERRVSVKAAGHPQGGFAAVARKKIRKALGKGKKKDKKLAGVKPTPSQPTMATWADIEGGDVESALGDEEHDDEEEELEGDVEEEEEDEEEKDLEWDPIDGMHAEKQKKVKDLKKMFDVKPPKYY